MATSATIRQTRTVLASGKFQLDSEITAADGFGTLALFLRDSDGEYQHVARVGDVEHYDETLGSKEYYRVSNVVLEYDTVEEAQAESDAQKAGLSNLVTDYEAYKNTYEGDETETYTAS